MPEFSSTYLCASPLRPVLLLHLHSLPNLTVGLLIGNSVSQAVLSFCRNIHLLSVYLHLRRRASSGCLLTLSTLHVCHSPTLLPVAWLSRSPFQPRFYSFSARGNFNLIVSPVLPRSSWQMALEMSHIPWLGVNYPRSPWTVSFTRIFTTLQCQRVSETGGQRWTERRKKESVG